jgi:hypothetical protein
MSMKLTVDLATQNGGRGESRGTEGRGCETPHKREVDI